MCAAALCTCSEAEPVRGAPPAVTVHLGPHAVGPHAAVAWCVACMLHLAMLRLHGACTISPCRPSPITITPDIQHTTRRAALASPCPALHPPVQHPPAAPSSRRQSAPKHPQQHPWRLRPQCAQPAPCRARRRCPRAGREPPARRCQCLCRRRFRGGRSCPLRRLPFLPKSTCRANAGGAVGCTTTGRAPTVNSHCHVRQQQAQQAWTRKRTAHPTRSPPARRPATALPPLPPPPLLVCPTR